MKIISADYLYPILLTITLLAFASLYFTIFLPYFGEEGQYTISAVEMFYHHYYWQPTTYGVYYWRPPFYNWLIVGVMHLTGVPKVLVAARIVAASSSVLTGLMLWFLTYRLFGQKLFALFTVAVLFSGDFLFRRGWIAYSDPLFALLVLVAIGFMWISVKEQRAIFWLPAPFALFAGMLTKAFTIYVFYATALIVLLAAYDHRNYFFKPASIVAHLTAILLPVLWFNFAPNTNLQAMLGDIIHKGITEGYPLGRSYLGKIFSVFFEVLYRFMPIDLVVLYGLFRYKHPRDQFPLNPQPVKPLLWILALSIAPYWLGPGKIMIRYFLPLYPFIAILFAYCIWRGGERRVELATVVLAIGLIIKCISSFIGLPWGENMDFPQQAIANDIIDRSESHQLYAGNMTSRLGLTIASIIDTHRWPNAPLTLSPQSLTKGCVITVQPDTQSGLLQQTYHAKGAGHLYLYCQ